MSFLISNTNSQLSNSLSRLSESFTFITLVILLFVATYERAIEKEKVADIESDLNLTENEKKSIANASRLRKQYVRHLLKHIYFDIYFSIIKTTLYFLMSTFFSRVDYSGFVENDCKSDDDVNFKIIASVQERSRKSKFIKTETITTTPNVPEFPNLKG